MSRSGSASTTSFQPSSFGSVLKTYLAVMLGGAAGTALRMGMTQWLTNRFGDHFPVGTLVVNVLGSFAIGIVASLLSPQGLFSSSLLTRQILMVGVLGGFTTFSSFSLQTLLLLQSGAWARAGMNVILSFALCMAAVWMGYAGGAMLSQR